MKKVIFLILSMMTIGGICKTMPLVQEISSTQENNKVDLSGNFPSTGARSVFEPIILIQHPGYLEAAFSNNLGMIIIKIRNEENNIIFQDSINTNIQKQYQILISNYDEGNFYIEFRNSQGQYMCGVFVIQE